MGYYTGQKITVNGAGLYISSTATKRSGRITGTYYIYSPTVTRGRVIVTIYSSYAGKKPANKYGTGWVNTSEIKSAAGSSSSSSSSSAKKPSTPSSSSSATSKPSTPTPVSPNSTANTTTSSATPPASDVTPSGTYPGQLGYLGKVVFLMTESQMKTLEGFSWSVGAEYAEHTRHLKKSKLEFTGPKLGEISFDITLSAFLGTNPMTDWNTLQTYCVNGTAIPFKVGRLNMKYGDYRWVITDLSLSGEHADKEGDWTQVKVSVSLKEYVQ